LALVAAVLFGVSTPLVQKFGAGVGAFATAALLYAGAAVAGALLRQRVENEARVVRGDFSRLLAMAAAGAVVGPVALAWGLQRTSGTSASLMLTLEALFTAVLAWRIYRETMDRRVWAAMLLLLAGGIVLVLDQAHDGGARLWGLLAVLVATAAWGVDNTLSRRLAERDPGQVVFAKAMLGAAATTLLAVGFGETLPAPGGSSEPTRYWCHRLRAEPSLLSVSAEGIRSRTHGVRLCLRPLHWRCAGRGVRRPIDQLADGSGLHTNVGRGGTALGGVARPRA